MFARNAAQLLPRPCRARVENRGRAPFVARPTAEFALRSSRSRSGAWVRLLARVRSDTRKIRAARRPQRGLSGSHSDRGAKHPTFAAFCIVFDAVPLAVSPGYGNARPAHDARHDLSIFGMIADDRNLPGDRRIAAGRRDRRSRTAGRFGLGARWEELGEVENGVLRLLVFDAAEGDRGELFLGALEQRVGRRIRQAGALAFFDSLDLAGREVELESNRKLALRLLARRTIRERQQLGSGDAVEVDCVA